MVDNPWEKDSDFAYTETTDGAVDGFVCESCAAEGDDVRRIYGALLCDTCALLENKMETETKK